MKLKADGVLNTNGDKIETAKLEEISLNYLGANVKDLVKDLKESASIETLSPMSQLAKDTKDLSMIGVDN